MDAQTLLVWAARLACPVALGSMLWLILRQTKAEAEPSSDRRMIELHSQHAVVEAEIEALEANTYDGSLMRQAKLPEAENATQ